MGRRELDILFLATRVALLFLLPPFISDVGIYLGYGMNLVQDGHIPYRDWDFEYPPLALPFMVLPALGMRLLSWEGVENFRALFVLLILPFDVLLYGAFRRRATVDGAAFLYIMLTCALGLLTYDRFDLAVGFLIAWPFLAEKPRFALWWGLGGALKLVPLLLAPARLLEERNARRVLSFAVLAALPLALCFAGVLLLTNGKIAFLAHHSERGVQIECLLGSLVMFLQAFTGLIKVGVQNNFGAQHLAAVPGLVAASRVLFYGMLASTLAGLALARNRFDSLSGAWLIVSGFVTFGYVLSPQYLLWLVPIGLCAAARVPVGEKRNLWIALFSAVVAVTGVHFRFYWDYVNLHHLAVSMVLARNLGLVVLWGLSWAWMSRGKTA